MSTDVLCLGTDGLRQTPVLYLCTCAVGRKEFSRLANEARQRGPNPKLGWEKHNFHSKKHHFTEERIPCQKNTIQVIQTKKKPFHAKKHHPRGKRHACFSAYGPRGHFGSIFLICSGPKMFEASCVQEVLHIFLCSNKREAATAF